MIIIIKILFLLYLCFNSSVKVNNSMEIRFVGKILESNNEEVENDKINNYYSSIGTFIIIYYDK